ncbi:MAG TPA: adenylyl-sulfate kinase, partial [Roseiflexaceae bacterium]|nr:adenylyl-sulfate kinase [Roseiflexaceae bacterium]
ARAVLGSRFAEVWVRCPIQICRTRDPKGLYSKAAIGDIQELPGVDATYEAPASPDVIVDADRQTPEQAAACVLAGLGLLDYHKEGVAEVGERSFDARIAIRSNRGTTAL